MTDEFLDEELSQMYDESAKPPKVLDATAFHTPIKSLKVRKPVMVSPDHSVAAAIELMQEKKLGCVAVTENEKLVGIFTERDVLMKIAGKLDPATLKVRDVMTLRPEAFQPEDSIAFILNAMHVGGYRHVPVVDDQGRPLAVASIKDIVSFILDHFAEDVLNLPPEPMRKTEQREGA
ncbi:MAG TPA: CBS domain-containing protein [Bacteroidetes bacterium]|nr:CBS domain-containing protein [Bacteroidota bacterium]